LVWTETLTVGNSGVSVNVDEGVNEDVGVTDDVGVMDGVKVNSGVLVAMAARVAATSLARAVWAAEVDWTIPAAAVWMAMVESRVGLLSTTGIPGKLQAERKMRKTEVFIAMNFFQDIAASLW
jgi:hypothetical protein